MSTSPSFSAHVPALHLRAPYQLDTVSLCFHHPPSLCLEVPVSASIGSINLVPRVTGIGWNGSEINEYKAVISLNTSQRCMQAVNVYGVTNKGKDRESVCLKICIAPGGTYPFQPQKIKNFFLSIWVIWLGVV